MIMYSQGLSLASCQHSRFMNENKCEKTSETLNILIFCPLQGGQPEYPEFKRSSKCDHVAADRLLTQGNG